MKINMLAIRSRRSPRGTYLPFLATQKEAISTFCYHDR